MATIRLLKASGLYSQVQKRAPYGFKLIIKNKIREIPFGLHILPLINFIKFPFLSKVGKSVKEYYSAVFGRKNFDSVFAPAFNAVISQNADNYPADLLLKRRKKRDRSSPSSFVFANGFQNIIKELLSHKNINLNTDSEVLSISRTEEQLYHLKTSKGEYTCKNLVLACPPVHGAKIVKSLSPEMSATLGKISCNTIASKGLVVQSSACSRKKFAGLFGENLPFYSIVTSDTRGNFSERGFAFHLKNEELPEEELCNYLKLLVDFKGDSPVCYYSEKTLPALNVNHLKILDELERQLAAIPNLYITGNYFGGVSIEDCVLRSESELLRFKKSKG
jgi:protoporphyrinogen oxidase